MGVVLRAHPRNGTVVRASKNEEISFLQRIAEGEARE